MKCIIAGSRTITDYTEVDKAVILSGFGYDITEVVSGCAAGVDKLGERWAIDHSIRVQQFPAQWRQYGIQAGYIRNQQMADYAGPTGALIALWDGKSRGTAHMISRANLGGLKVYIHRV